MHINQRYKPKVQYMGFEEFGDKFFRPLDEINYYDKNIPRKDKVYPMGWDDYQDRDLVWLSTPKMIQDYINGVKRFVDNNPINIIDLNSNYKSLHPIENSTDREYYKKFIDLGYDYFIFIGKNRITLPVFTIYQGIKSGDKAFDVFKMKDENGEYLYQIEFKLFESNIDNQWKGEFYRAEKTIFPDSDIMMRISYDCPINKWIYDWSMSESNIEKFSKTWDDSKIILAKHKQFIDECMAYEEFRNWTTCKTNKGERRWSESHKIPKEFNRVWRRFEKMYDYIDEYSSNDSRFISRWKSSENKLRIMYQLISDLNDENLEPSRSFGYDGVFNDFFEWFERELTVQDAYGYSGRGTSLDFNQLTSGMKVTGSVYERRDKSELMEGVTQHSILSDVIYDKFILPLLISKDLITVKSRTRFNRYELFWNGGQRVRINGKIRKRDGSEVWFNDDDTDRLYLENISLKEFLDMDTAIDHIVPLRSGGLNDESNLEITSRSFNTFKSDYDLVV